MPSIMDLEARLGLEFQLHQVQSLAAASVQDRPRQRRTLFFKTGAGKTLTALALMAVWGEKQALVVAPPSTHAGWREWGLKVGVAVDAISHAKFRMKTYQLSRTMPIIVDEFHMLGGHGAQGWKKMDRLAAGLQAPMLLLSATPNYNDAERVYCVQHVMDPTSCRGGYVQFLYTHCITQENPFSPGTPDVTGFKNYASAIEYLVALPNVDYLEDDLVYTIVDTEYKEVMPPEYEEFGLNIRKRRMIASRIEDTHIRRYQGLVGEDGRARNFVNEKIKDLYVSADGPLLVYANHASVAKGVIEVISEWSPRTAVITGATSKSDKEEILRLFNRGQINILVGTASLATGTDGMDKVCNMMLIVDDTDDPSLRRQLIGRIMPRGLDTDATGKQVHRLIPAP